MLGTVSIANTTCPYVGAYHLCSYTMCCYSNSEEWMTEVMWRDKVPIKLETALKESGAIMEQE
jgi:hypothetical protein